MTHKDYYQILEVNPKARPEVIKAAYDTLVQIYDPDTNKGCEDIVKSMNEAKDILLNDNKRTEYDIKRNDLTGKTVKNYSILEMISDGDLGTTYKAKHLLTEGLVCLKHAHYVSSQDEEMIMDEAKTLWDLRHYSIPTLRDIITMDDGGLALITSYIPGPNLEQIILRNDRLDPEHVMWITQRSLNALKYLHYNGVVHGDLQPKNIIVQPESHDIALVNYGLSAIRPNIDTKVKGANCRYSSPEQTRKEIMTPKSDIYSLGVTMIYALGGDVSERKIPAGVPDDICRFVKRMIEPDPTKRPDWSTEDLVDTIQKLRMKNFGRNHSGMKPIPGF